MRIVKEMTIYKYGLRCPCCSGGTIIAASYPKGLGLYDTFRGGKQWVSIKCDRCSNHPQNYKMAGCGFALNAKRSAM